METIYVWDAWPVMADGSQYDGKRLLSLVRSNQSPFHQDWDVDNLISEVETEMEVQISDIPLGFHIKTADGRDLIVRLARGDVNMPHWEGCPVHKQVSGSKFEAAVYEMLHTSPDIRTSKLLYSRVPVQYPSTGNKPTDIKGRNLFVFERAEGSVDQWIDLSPAGKYQLLDQLAIIRAALYNFQVPAEFAASHLHEQTFDFKAEFLSMDPAPTRDFWLHVMTSKIEATIKEPGDQIGWECDDQTVGTRASLAKASLLRALPYMLPAYEKSLYRFVLEHGDFGIHNVSINVPNADEPQITTLFDWETASIVPAMLSDPMASISHGDLIVDQDGEATITRIHPSTTNTDLALYTAWAAHYIDKLCQLAPDFRHGVQAGRDVRRIWFALRDWRGSDPEQFFGELGEWADARMREMGVA